MALASELSLDAVLLRIVELAVDLTGARYGALGVLSPDGRTIEEFITVGITPEERAALGDPPTGHGLLGALIREARPLRIPDISADPRSVGFPPNHPPMKSLLGAPITGRGKVFGNIYLTDKQAPTHSTRRTSECSSCLLRRRPWPSRTLACTTRPSQRGELQRLEVLEERERIAKELHDGVIQSLFAVGMQLQGGDGHAARQHLPRRWRLPWTTSTKRSAISAITSSACAPASWQIDNSIRRSRRLRRNSPLARAS